MDGIVVMTLKDEREVLGQEVTWNRDAVAHCMADVDLRPNVLNVHFVMPTPEEVDKQWPGTFDWDFEKGVCDIRLAVSDRPEFSDRAIMRLSRSLVQLLRSAATVQNLVEFFGPIVGAGVYAHFAHSEKVPGGFDALSYAYAKQWYNVHGSDLCALVQAKTSDDG